MANDPLLDDVLTEEEFLDVLKKKFGDKAPGRQALIRWRQKRIGPPSAKIGRQVVYRRQGIAAWLEGTERAAPARGKRAAR